jgi:hypothetical protein
LPDPSVAAGSKVSISVPALAGTRGRDREVERLPPAIDQEQELVVDHRAAAVREVRGIGSVEVEGDAAGLRIAPVGVRHRSSGRGEAQQLPRVLPDQESAPPEQRSLHYLIRVRLRGNP